MINWASYWLGFASGLSTMFFTILTIAFIAIIVQSYKEDNRK